MAGSETTLEVMRFLTEGTRTGKLATVRENEQPYVVPVWFIIDGDEIVFNTWHSTVNANNMRRDLRVGFCVSDYTPPFSHRGHRPDH